MLWNCFQPFFVSASPFISLCHLFIQRNLNCFSNHMAIVEDSKMKDKMNQINVCLFFYFLFVFFVFFVSWCYNTDLVSWISFIKCEAFLFFFLILSFISRPCTPYNFTVNWGHHHICFSLWFPNVRSFYIYSLILLWHSTSISKQKSWLLCA